jgi:hypothetical protein
MSKNVKIEPQMHKIWANLDFLVKIHGLVQKNQNGHKKLFGQKQKTLVQ